MTERNPYTALRPYYKGHNRAEDERLTKELFFGMTVRNEKTGRDCHYYLPDNSPEERLAFEALVRLLVFSCGDLNEDALGGLLSSLDRGGSFERRLVFEKKRKRPADAPADLQIFLYVERRIRAGQQVKTAVDDAVNKFKVTRKTVFAARRRIRRESPWLESPWAEV
jgi:hypothetical protein